MKQVLFLFAMFVINAALNAQSTDSCSYELKGVILDVDTKETLPYVLVNVKGTSHSSLTDINGEFHIENLCDPINTLIISCLGYCDTTCQHFHEDSRKPNFYLKKEVNALEAITITAEKIKEEGTASIAQQTIGRELLSADLTQTLASALADIKGVTFTSTGTNVQLPVIHGLYGNRVLTINNGIQHGFQNWGNEHAPEIDISAADRITVVKGAAGVRYGPEALGGAIIVEADPLYLNEPLKAQVGTGFQTNGNGYFANAKIGQGLEKWSYHLGINYTRIGDRFAPDYSLTNSGKEEKSLNAGFRYHLEDVDVKVYYSFLDQNLALLRSSIANSGTAFVRGINSTEPVIISPFSYDINEPNQLAQHHLAKVEVDWWYVEDAKLTFRVGSQLNKREEYDVRRNADRPIVDLDLITNDFQVEWKHSDWFGLDGLIGAQVFIQNNDNNPGTGTTPLIPNYNTSRYSAFVIESFKSNKGTFEAGLRLDHEYNNVRGRETNQDLFTDSYRFT
ncbi:MAG: TonB-dependent receptor plug domain-containing protein, partial [Bacteroidota bacterium]